MPWRGMTAVYTSTKPAVAATREDRLRERGVQGEGNHQRASGSAYPPRNRPQGAVRQLRAHLALQGLERSRKPAAAGLPVPAPGAAATHLPATLAAGHARGLGQPLHPAPADQRLRRLPPRHAPRHPCRRPRRRDLRVASRRSVSLTCPAPRATQGQDDDPGVSALASLSRASTHGPNPLGAASRSDRVCKPRSPAPKCAMRSVSKRMLTRSLTGKRCLPRVRQVSTLRIRDRSRLQVVSARTTRRPARRCPDRSPIPALIAASSSRRSAISSKVIPVKSSWSGTSDMALHLPCVGLPCSNRGSGSNDCSVVYACMSRTIARLARADNVRGPAYEVPERGQVATDSKYAVPPSAKRSTPVAEGSG